MILTRQFWTYGLPLMGIILHNIALTYNGKEHYS